MEREEGFEGRAGGSEEDVDGVEAAEEEEEVWGVVVGIVDAPDIAID